MVLQPQDKHRHPVLEVDARGSGDDRQDHPWASDEKTWSHAEYHYGSSILVEQLQQVALVSPHP